MIAISTDDAATSKRFRESLKAPYHFVADDQALVVKAFDVKVFLFTIAKRVTFVIGAGRKVLSVQEGSDALDPSGAVTACSLKPPEALKFVTGSGASLSDATRRTGSGASSDGGATLDAGSADASQREK